MLGVCVFNLPAGQQHHCWHWSQPAITKATILKGSGYG